MKKTLSLCLCSAALILALLAAGCQSTVQGTQAAPTPPGATPTVSNGSGYPYPGPNNPTQDPANAPTDPYAAPADPNSAGSGDVPTAYPQPQATGIGSAFPTQTGDEGLTRGNFFVDSVKLQPATEPAGSFDLVVTGSLPTPCNMPRAEVSAPDAQNKIVVTLYSLVEKDKVCAEVIEPFEGRVATLGGYPSGKYTVMVNDQPAVEMTIP